jgi:hypothetical protein
MKQIYVVLTILLTLNANADWKALKKLDYYEPKAFTLKKGVAYVEIRKYSKNTSIGISDISTTSSENVIFKMYRHPLSYFGSTGKRAFSLIPGKKKFAFKKSEISHIGGSQSWYYNGFMLDSNGKQWRLENIQDVIDMIRPIDTPAEVRLVLWLHGVTHYSNGKYSIQYRKNGKEYVIKEHYVCHECACGCGDYSYQYKVNRSGKITQKKLLRKKAVKLCECGGS